MPISVRLRLSLADLNTRRALTRESRRVKITTSAAVAAPRDRVFEALNDREVLRRSIPGCEELTDIDADSFLGTAEARHCRSQGYLRRDRRSAGGSSAGVVHARVRREGQERVRPRDGCRPHRRGGFGFRRGMPGRRSDRWRGRGCRVATDWCGRSQAHPRFLPPARRRDRRPRRQRSVRPEARFTVRLILSGAAVLWAASLPLAVYAAQPADAAPSASSIFALTVYQIGSIVCHQRPERSFHLASLPLPVCARCTGIYAGAAIAAVVATIRLRASGLPPSGSGIQARRRRRRRSRHRPRGWCWWRPPCRQLATLVYEWSSGQTPSNEFRALTGLILGAGVAWILLRLE